VFACLTQPIPYSPYAGQVLAEYRSGAAAMDPERKYAYGTYIDEPLVLLSSLNSQPSSRYYHQNRLYNVTGLTDSTATVVERYAYDAHGQIIILDGAGTPLPDQSSTVGNPFTYTGRELDTESSLLYFRARYLEAVIGRYLSRDPAGFVDGANLYRPHHVPDRTDPSGCAVSCPGGKWFFSGDKWGGEVLGGYYYLRLQWVCAKREKVSTITWKCCDGTEFTQDEYRVAQAKGAMSMGVIGAGIGGSWKGVAGTQTGANSSDDLAGWSWSGVSAGITIIIVGASGGAAPGQREGEAGLEGGLGVTVIQTGVSHTSIWTSGYKFDTSHLDPRYRKMIDDHQCTSTRKMINPPVTESNPNRPFGLGNSS